MGTDARSGARGAGSVGSLPVAGAPAGLSERSQGALARSDDLGAGAAADLGAGIGAAGLGAAGSGADGVGAATGAAFGCVALALEDAGGTEGTGCGSADTAARADGECSSC